MAEQACQKGDHGARHAGHLDEQAEKDEQRHGQQDEMAHALVHAPDQDHERRMRRQRQVAEDGKAEREGDRHAGKDGGGHDADEEDQQIEVAELEEQRCGEPEQRDENGHGAGRNRDRSQRSGAADAKRREHRHQRYPARQRRGTPGVVQPERRRRDESFFLRILVSRPRDQQQKCQRGAGREQVERRPRRRRQAADGRGHAHMLVAAERDHRAEHRQPQEQNRGQLIRPDQRMIEDVARNDAAEQNDNFGCNQRCRQNLDDSAKRRSRAPSPRSASA